MTVEQAIKKYCKNARDTDVAMLFYNLGISDEKTAALEKIKELMKTLNIGA